METDRYFQNKFTKGQNLPNFQILENDSHKLSQKLTESFHESVKKLLLDFERNISNEIDWKDVSVYTGASGYIVLFLKIFKYLNEDLYVQKALSYTEKSLKHLNGRRISFLCGDAGPLALGAIVYNQLNKDEDAKNCISRLIKLKDEVLDQNSELPDELLYGRVGYLYSLLFLEQKVHSYSVDHELIRNVVTAILESGKSLARKRKLKVPLAYEWHGKNYFGAAHGVCGILSLLLQAKDILTSSELNDLIKPTIDGLTKHIFSSGNLASSEGSTTDRLVHWCHGAPAAVFLFAMAFKVFGDERYLDIAAGAANVVWTRGLLKKGYGLCHGTAGNGYALLFMYQITKQEKYLNMAVQFARWCQEYGTHGCRTPDRPFSLFEGLAGTIYFLIDIQEPLEAKFPCFII